MSRKVTGKSKSGAAKLCPSAKSSLPPILLNKVLLEHHQAHLFIVYGSLPWQWQSYIVATETIWPTKSCLSLYRKSLPMSDLNHELWEAYSTENGRHPARNAISSNFSRLGEAKKNTTSASRDSWWNRKLWRHWALLQLAVIIQKAHGVQDDKICSCVRGKWRKPQWLNATDNCNSLRIRPRVFQSTSGEVFRDCMYHERRAWRGELNEILDDPWRKGRNRTDKRRSSWEGNTN